MTMQTTPRPVPALAGALAHLNRNGPGRIDVSFRPIDGRGLSVAIRPERLRDREQRQAHAEHATYRWLAAVRDIGLLPLGLDARLTGRALASGADTPVLATADVAALVDRLRARIAETTGLQAAPFPDVLIRVAKGAQQVRIAGTDGRVLAIRDALAAETLGWLAVHGSWWEAAGTFAVKLEPETLLARDYPRRATTVARPTTLSGEDR